MRRESLSLIILTKNSEAHIQECLASVSWADEIVILDSGSTDNTLDICRQFTNKITITEDWPGFGIQKNRALSQATKDWVLELDSDEVLDPRLQTSIRQTLIKPEYDAYQIQVIAYFLNQKIRFSGWAKYKLRLFRRNIGKYDNSLIHETLIHQAKKVGRLAYPIYNHTCDNVEQLLDKSRLYIVSGAEKRYAQGKRSGIMRAFIKGILRALKSYIFRLGFLDGKAGFIIAVGNFYQTFYVHLQLWYLDKKSRK